MELWQLALSIAGIGVPAALAIMARDRAIMQMISDGKEEARRSTEEQVKAVHDRINRVRDEYVRRDDLEGHLRRIEKAFDDMRDDNRRTAEQTSGELREIKQMLNSLAGVRAP